MKTQQFIYITDSDKAKIFKQANSHQISVSTYVDIIVQNYKYMVEVENFNKYIEKGKNRICIKTKNCKNLSNQLITNCIYCYLHNDYLQTIKQINPPGIKNLNKTIQSTADKTIDKNYDLNRIIRATYTANKILKR